MSTFCGRMREYRSIAIDRFDGANLECTVYFLSHKHTDHMVGLSDDNLTYRLSSNRHIKLYVSSKTRQLLIADRKYAHLAPSMVALPLNEPTVISVTDNVSGKPSSDVTVTLLRAEHCVGSVMFLFEGKEGTALYTGDFRLSRTDLQTMNCLHSGSRPKHIDSLYVDTTFCVPQALFIPGRLESTQAVIELIQEWISQGSDRYVVLKTRARIGYEQLFVDVAEYFETKVHVNADVKATYDLVEGLPDFCTEDPSTTKIHACRYQTDRHPLSRLPCGYHPKGQDEVKVRVITLSTMYFTQRVNLDEYVVKVRGHHRVCYSFHSSYGEVRDMILYLRPSRASANVIPINNTMRQVEERLSRFVAMATESVAPATESQPRLLGVQKKRSRKRLVADDDDSQMFPSPTPKATKKSEPTKDSETKPGTDKDKPSGDSSPTKCDTKESNDKASHANTSDAGKDEEGTKSDAKEQSSPTKSVDGLVWKSLFDDSEEVSSSQDYVDLTSDRDDDVMSDYVASDRDDAELDMDDVAFVDDEIKSTQNNFVAIENGSFGSHIAYMSESEGEEEVWSEPGFTQEPAMEEGPKEHSSGDGGVKCQDNDQNGESLAEDGVHLGGGDCDVSSGDKQETCEESGSQNLTLHLQTSSTEQDSVTGEHQGGSDGEIIIVPIDEPEETQGNNSVETNVTLSSDVCLSDTHKDSFSDDTDHAYTSKSSEKTDDNTAADSSERSPSKAKTRRSIFDDLDSDATVDLSCSQERDNLPPPNTQAIVIEPILIDCVPESPPLEETIEQDLVADVFIDLTEDDDDVPAATEVRPDNEDNGYTGDTEEEEEEEPEGKKEKCEETPSEPLGQDESGEGDLQEEANKHEDCETQEEICITPSVPQDGEGSEKEAVGAPEVASEKEADEADVLDEEMKDEDPAEGEDEEDDEDMYGEPSSLPYRSTSSDIECIGSVPGDRSTTEGEWGLFDELLSGNSDGSVKVVCQKEKMNKKKRRRDSSSDSEIEELEVNPDRSSVKKIDPSKVSIIPQGRKNITLILGKSKDRMAATAEKDKSRPVNGERAVNSKRSHPEITIDSSGSDPDFSARSKNKASRKNNSKV